MIDHTHTAPKLMEALRQLENTTSTTEKRQLLARFDKQLPEFRSMLVYALDPYKRYGVARFPTGSGRTDGTNTWHDIYYFLDCAAQGDMSGSQLTRYLLKVSENMNSNTRELFRRIMLKDLRCGVGATLVNSVMPGLIPQFSCMLAETLEERHIKRLQVAGKVYGQPKMNGDRAVTVIPDANTFPEMLSRKGFPLHNYQTIARALSELRRIAKREGIVFDGEAIVGDFWKTRGTKKLAGNEAEGAVLHVFDCVEYDQWKRGETDNFSVRAKLLKELSSLPFWEACGVLSRVPTMLLKDVTWDGLSALRDQLITSGYEGLIIRLDLGYDFSSSARNNMYKHKKMDTLDCVILEVLPGEADKKLADTAAKLKIELPNGQECLAGMGKGLNRAALDKLWRLRGRYVGLVAEISYQEKTVNESGEWRLQFPKFTGVVRQDKS